MINIKFIVHILLYRVGDAGAKKPTMMLLTLISHSFVTVSLITDTTTNDHFLLLVSLQILLLVYQLLILNKRKNCIKLENLLLLLNNYIFTMPTYYFTKYAEVTI